VIPTILDLEFANKEGCGCAAEGTKAATIYSELKPR
jgi:hypothetical protein